MREQSFDDSEQHSLLRHLPRRLGAIVISVVIGLVLVWAAFSTIENVDAGEIAIIQNPITGNMAAYTTPGPKAQWFGKVTKYRLRDKLDFDTKIRFNDGAHATMKGSIQFELPMDPQRLLDIHRRYGSQEAVKKQLIETVVIKSIYMSGPLMSSKESYAEKRNSLIDYIDDQVARGVYKTVQRDTTVEDPLSHATKTVTVVEIQKDTHGNYLRNEAAVLTGFGVKPFNLSISSLDYDGIVEKQIMAQQQAVAAVQTAMANARKSEQDAVTAQKNGEAMVATARAREEAVKAASVTVAERQRDVARLQAEAAGFTKTRDILLGEGEGQKRRLIMAADGALEQKLKTYENVSRMYADAIKGYQGAWVPSVIMGGSANGTFNGGTSLIDMLSAKTARDLSLDLSQGRAPAKR